MWIFATVNLGVCGQGDLERDDRRQCCPADSHGGEPEVSENHYRIENHIPSRVAGERPGTVFCASDQRRSWQVAMRP